MIYSYPIKDLINSVYYSKTNVLWQKRERYANFGYIYTVFDREYQAIYTNQLIARFVNIIFLFWKS